MIVPNIARRIAALYLADALPRRWTHVQAVAARAEELKDLHREGDLLTAAAWLHDVGYAPVLAMQRFDPIDGARAVRALGGESRLSNPIAFHSAAAHEATAVGLSRVLHDEFSDESSLIRDLLWYLDMTTSPDGDTVTFGDRIMDVRARYPTAHYVIRALDASMADRASAVSRAQEWLSGLA